MERGQRAKVNVEVATSVADLVASEHWNVRGMTVVADRPGDAARPGGSTRGLGPVFRIAGGAYRPPHPAPTLGGTGDPGWAHPAPTPEGPATGLAAAGAGAPGASGRGTGGAGGYGAPGASGRGTGIRGFPAGAGAGGAPPGSGGPLAGIRVIELTTAWAGPMAGRILAFMGAEVIHIEPATRLNSWRHHKAVFNPRRFPDGAGGERPFNRASLFNSQNPNKLSLTLDLKKPDGTEILKELLQTADVLVSNFLPGFLERSGFSYEQIRQYKPDIIVVEMPAYGRTGPMAKSAALGPTMEMAAGMSALIGYPGGGPVTTGPAYLDPIGGFNGAAAILTALHHRMRTGEGQHVEMPQVEAAMHYIGASCCDAAATGQDPERHGNHVSWAAPHDAFPARATTNGRHRRHHRRRMAGAVSGDQPTGPKHRRPLRHLHRPWPTIPTSSTRPSSADHRARPTRPATLQAAGVPAAPVAHGADAFADPVLRQIGFITTVDHPEAGRHDYPGLAYRLHRTPGRLRRAAPGFGEHNRAVLHDLLGLDAAAIDRLYAAGTVADQPRPGSEPS